MRTDARALDLESPESLGGTDNSSGLFAERVFITVRERETVTALIKIDAHGVRQLAQTLEQLCFVGINC